MILDWLYVRVHGPSAAKSPWRPLIRPRGLAVLGGLDGDFAGGRRQFGVGRASLLATTAFAAIVWALSPAAAAGSASHKLSCAKLTGLPIAKRRS